MNDDTLTRLDTALRLLAVVSHNLRALMTQPEPEMEPEMEPEPVLTKPRLSPTQRQVVYMLDRFEHYGKVPSVTLEELVYAAFILYPRGDENKRDMRKISARRDVRVLIREGFLVQKENGELTLEGARPLQDSACL